MTGSPFAGKPATAAMLVILPKLIAAYDTDRPDPPVPWQRVACGTSRHRGSARDTAFNEDHILAISQAICPYRVEHSTDGPLFLGMDTRALSVPARASALEVLAANGVTVMIAEGVPCRHALSLRTMSLFPVARRRPEHGASSLEQDNHTDRGWTTYVDEPTASSTPNSRKSSGLPRLVSITRSHLSVRPL